MTEPLIHEESQTDIPNPLRTSFWFYAGMRTIPANALSLASLLALGVILVLLQRNEGMRSLFVLPFPIAPVIGIAAIIAWIIVYTCRQRPGRHWPRYWALLLAILASLVTVTSTLPVPTNTLPLLHAASLAIVAAVITLLPRLLKLRPDSPWLQRIAPLHMLVVVGAIVLFSTYFQHQVVDGPIRQVNDHLDRITQTTATLEAIAQFDWHHVTTTTDTAIAAIARLEAVDSSQLIDAPEVWRQARRLGHEQQLTGVVRELIDAE